MYRFLLHIRSLLEAEGIDSGENTEDEAEQLPASHLKLSLLELELASSSDESLSAILFLKYRTFNGNNNSELLRKTPSKKL